MEEGQIDQDDVQITSGDDYTKSTTQMLKGNKVLATPAVRRIAMENNVRKNPIFLVWCTFLFQCDFVLVSFFVQSTFTSRSVI